MSNVQEVWWRPGGRSPFALDPTKPRLPQIASAIGQTLIIFGGPIIGLVAINHYPFLIENRTIYIGGLVSIVFWFLASFACLVGIPFRAACRETSSPPFAPVSRWR